MLNTFVPLPFECKCVTAHGCPHSILTLSYTNLFQSLYDLSNWIKFDICMKCNKFFYSKHNESSCILVITGKLTLERVKYIVGFYILI